MTDLEITRLCAEAMEPGPKSPGSSSIWAHSVTWAGTEAGRRDRWVKSTYDPLHDDAQALAMVKKLALTITHPDWTKPLWQVVYGQSNFYAISQDLNRAICECVAKMQAAK